MAIGNLSKGRDGAGLLRYVLRERASSGHVRSRRDIICSTMGSEPEQIIHHLAAFAALRPTLSINIIHNSIRLSPNDRTLSDAEWRDMATFWSTGMGIDGYLTVCHGDHIHILCSRNRIDGGVVEDSGDYSKSEKLIREIEQRFDLTPVLPSHLIDKNRRSDHVAAPVRGELELAKRHVISAKSFLQNFLTDLTSVPITASDFIFALETLGVDVRPNLDHKSRGLRGLSFSYHGRSFRASTLGGAFTVASMTERGFSYDSDRDFSNLVAAEHRSLANAPDRQNGAIVATDRSLDPSNPGASRNEVQFEEGHAAFKIGHADERDDETRTPVETKEDGARFESPADQIGDTEHQVQSDALALGTNQHLPDVLPIVLPRSSSEQPLILKLPDLFKTQERQNGVSRESTKEVWHSYQRRLVSKLVDLISKPPTLIDSNPDDHSPS